MPAFNKFDTTMRDIAHKKHDFSADTVKWVLTNVTPVRTNQVLADITEIAAGNGYVAGGNVSATLSSGQTAGVYKLVVDDPTWSAVGGSFGPFQYAVGYNDSSTGKRLLGWYDYGAPVTINDGEPFTLDLDQLGGLLTLQ
jgi:hypothetical protein